MKNRIPTLDEFIYESVINENTLCINKEYWDNLGTDYDTKIDILATSNCSNDDCKQYCRADWDDIPDEIKKKIHIPVYTSNGSIAVQEKSTSIAQQRLFGHAFAIRKGKAKREGAPKAVLAIVDGKMTDKEIEDFASTSHEGLPKHANESNTRIISIDEFVNEGKQLKFKTEGELKNMSIVDLEFEISVIDEEIYLNEIKLDKAKSDSSIKSIESYMDKLESYKETVTNILEIKNKK